MINVRIGAHVSVNGGLLAALEKAATMGANCMQIFASPPRSFAPSKITLKEGKEFQKKARESDIHPVVIHATYLINLASDNENLRRSSITSLVDDLTVAEKIGALGSIVHTGSHKGQGFDAVLPTVVDSIYEVLKQTSSGTKLYLEIASGGNGKIGSSFEELRAMLDCVADPRVGICLDSAHMFAGGYAFDTKDKVEELANKISNTVGWGSIGCLHANDSKVEFDSGRDRHENIGEGYIGTEPFHLLLAHPPFRSLPWILEVPGFGKKKEPDKKNIDVLKSLI